MMKTKKLLKEAILDEKKAPGEYINLKRYLKTKTDKKVIDIIIRDEKKHLKALKKIKRKY